MALASNRFAKYVVQQDQESGGAAPAPKPNKFAKYKQPAAEAAPANPNATNPIILAQRASQQKAGNDWVAKKAAAEAASKERAIYSAASGMPFTGGEDGSIPQLNTNPGPVFTDIGKGIATAPQHIERGVVSGVESMINLPSDVADFLNSANKGTAAEQKPVPRADFSGAKVGIPEGYDSVSGNLAEGLAQFLVARKLIGTAAPGGGVAPQLGKDAAAVFTAFDGRTGRLADIIDSNAVPEGPLRNYLNFLKTQPDDSPLWGRFKNFLEDMTVSGPMVAPQVAVRGAQAVGNALTPPARPAGPSPASVSPIPQAGPRTAQGGPPSPGQQPPPGPAPAAPGVTGGQGGGVLNAVPAAPVIPKGQIRVAKDTAKILSRIMRSSRIKDADITGYLPGAVQRYKGLNDPSVPFAFFLEGDLPNHFPQPIAEEVVTKLQTWGRERNAATGPQDTSRRTIQQTVKTLREGQQDYLSGVMDQNLYKGKLIGQEDKLKADLKANAKTAYDTALQNANNGLLSGRATVDQRNALGKIQELLHNDAFLKQVPQHLRIKAMREGIDLEDFVQKDPLAAAHWLQSELRQAVSAAEGVGGAATSESRLYGEMRQALLDQLETAVPGYKGARKAHGDIYGAVEALDFGNSFFKAARSEVETARLARQFKALSKRQQTAATMSIRDALKNEFRNKAEDTAAKVTRLQQAGVLEALETVLGADGKRVADGIRNIVKQNDRLKAIDQGSGSPTYSNQRGGDAAREMVQSPVNKAVGQFGDKTSWPVTIAGDIMLGTQGIPPLLTTSKVASAVVDRFGNPSPKMLSRATEGLYGLPTPPPANALSGPPTPRGGRPRTPAPAPTQQTLDDLLREYDAIDHRSEPGKAAQVLKKIDALKKKLAKAEADASALSAPPSPPVKGPVNKAGMGVSEGAGAVGGGVAGYALAPDENNDGVVDAGERARYALGGAVSIGVIAKGGKLVGNSLRGEGKAAKQARLINELDVNPDTTPGLSVEEAEALRRVQAMRPVEKGPPDSAGLFSGGKGPPKPPGSPTQQELRISESINEMRSRGASDEKISYYLKTQAGVNIAPERIEHFAQMTPPTGSGKFKGNVVSLKQQKANREPPAQAGFFSGGKGPPPDAPKTELQRVRAKQEILPADPKAPEGKPGAAPYRMTSTRSKTPISLARKEDALRKEVTNARRAESRARSSDIVIRDDRDAIIKSKWDRRVRAEKRLEDYLERRAKREAFVSGLQDFAEKGSTGKKIAIGAATGTALMAGGYALSALSGKHEKGGPTDPRDPKFYWEEIVSKDESLMSQIQTSLDRDWGLWPKEVAVTGRKGKTTKAAIWHWRKERGLNPDDPMSKKDVERLLAGPKGYQDKKSGDWRYPRDGSPVRLP